jgi:hypothetical protein
MKAGENLSPPQTSNTFQPLERLKTVLSLRVKTVVSGVDQKLPSNFEIQIVYSFTCTLPQPPPSQPESLPLNSSITFNFLI